MARTQHEEIPIGLEYGMKTSQWKHEGEKAYRVNRLWEVFCLSGFPPFENGGLGGFSFTVSGKPMRFPGAFLPRPECVPLVDPSTMAPSLIRRGEWSCRIF